MDIVKKFHDEFGPTVDTLMKTKALEKRIPRAIREVRRIGRHPDTGQMIETCKARYGPVVKMGDGYKDRLREDRRCIDGQSGLEYRGHHAQQEDALTIFV